MRSLTLVAVVLTACALSPAQSATDSSASSLPPLEHFNPDQVDKSLDPCTDFFQYVCSKWIKANPIPPDQDASGTYLQLFLWNTAAVRNTLEDAAKSSPNRTPVERPRFLGDGRLESLSQLPALAFDLHRDSLACSSFIRYNTSHGHNLRFRCRSV
jgi:hypothetical protein